jgi:hypothetical protein
MAKLGLFAELVEDVRIGRRREPERAAAIVASEYLEGMGPVERGDIAFRGFNEEDKRNVRSLLEDHGIVADAYTLCRMVCRHAVEQCDGHWTGFVLNVPEGDDPDAAKNVVVEGTVPHILDQAMEFLAVAGAKSEWCKAAGIKILNRMASEGYIDSANITSNEASKLVEPWWCSRASFIVRLVNDQAELRVKVPDGGKWPPENLPVGVQTSHNRSDESFSAIYTQDVGPIQDLPIGVLRKMLRPDRSAYARWAAEGGAQ